MISKMDKFSTGSPNNIYFWGERSTPSTPYQNEILVHVRGDCRDGRSAATSMTPRTATKEVSDEA